MSQRSKKSSGGLATRVALTVLRGVVPWAGCWLLLAACGGAMEAQAPGGDAAAGVEEAEVNFEEAEQTLHALLSSEAGGEEGVAAEAPPPAQAPVDLSARDRAQSKASHQLGHRCERACGALGSMQRSADGLCDLTGEPDDRCGSVRERVRLASQLVSRVCPDCG